MEWCGDRQRPQWAHPCRVPHLRQLILQRAGAPRTPSRHYRDRVGPRPPLLFLLLQLSPQCPPSWLERHGLKLLSRSPSSIHSVPGWPVPTCWSDGRYLLVGLDAEMNLSEITKFSSKDATAYPKSQASFTCAAYLETILTWIRFSLHLAYIDLDLD
jgi:hypothetical protein